MEVIKAPFDYANTQETDLQSFVNLYKRVGIDCKVNVLSDRQTIIIGDSEYLSQNPTKQGEYWSWTKDRVVGYSGFCTILTFDLEGKFVNHGAWEN